MGLAFLLILTLLFVFLYAWLGWVAAAAAGILLIYLLAEGLGLDYIARRFSRRKQPSSLVCSRCDYDLRATPERCPECGAVPAVK
jgi:hypothetical protein